MNDPVLAAADNNARWCDLICRSHHIPTSMERGHWAALRRSPDRYPDAVTLLPGTLAEDVLRLTEAGPGCSVKDSFADLDLARLGFHELFQAHWIFRESAPFTKAAAAWSVVENEEELAKWAHAAGAENTFRGELLRDPSVRILAAPGPGGPAAGAIANRTGSVVGVSNVFAKTMSDEQAWAEIAAELAGLFPSLPLVGYEQGDVLQAALASGFSEIGSLRVWLRPGKDS